MYNQRQWRLRWTPASPNSPWYHGVFQPSRLWWNNPFQQQSAIGALLFKWLLLPQWSKQFNNYLMHERKSLFAWQFVIHIQFIHVQRLSGLFSEENWRPLLQQRLWGWDRIWGRKLFEVPSNDIFVSWRNHRRNLLHKIQFHSSQFRLSNW